MRIILADDQSDVRSALRLLLEQETGLTVVGEVARQEELLSAIEAMRPDVLLLDWELPGLPAPELMPRLQRDVRVVILSSRPEARQAALAAGADAFISKGDTPECVLDTIHRL